MNRAERREHVKKMETGAVKYQARFVASPAGTICGLCLEVVYPPTTDQGDPAAKKIRADHYRDCKKDRDVITWEEVL